MKDFYTWFNRFHYGQKHAIIKDIETNPKLKALRSRVPYLKTMVGTASSQTSAMIAEEVARENPRKVWRNGKWEETLF